MHLLSEQLTLSLFLVPWFQVPVSSHRPSSSKILRLPLVQALQPIPTFLLKPLRAASVLPRGPEHNQTLLKIETS